MLCRHRLRERGVHRYRVCLLPRVQRGLVRELRQRVLPDGPGMPEELHLTGLRERFCLHRGAAAGPGGLHVRKRKL
uniref:Uncharacterized protein n=1 Tax=Spironucleus salmonicida TaxID=348837 RepID=V6LI20_9EUKA|eukprot:EST44210.1 Hypothetical protein SS50377_16020 [Spironucleus salmonicida]